MMSPSIRDQVVLALAPLLDLLLVLQAVSSVSTTVAAAPNLKPIDFFTGKTSSNNYRYFNLLYGHCK
jgi:hypothetical protein